MRQFGIDRKNEILLKTMWKWIHTAEHTNRDARMTQLLWSEVSKDVIMVINVDDSTVTVHATGVDDRPDVGNAARSEIRASR